MANIRVCARFRPAILQDDGEVLRSARSDSRSFTLQDENDEQHTFSFDKVFYEDSEQAYVYEFLARPLVRGFLICYSLSVVEAKSPCPFYIS
ncbi:putative kinesin motor domain, P-loop containing nucleoside triphosphate hydrolase [Helianthus anomalus]